MSVFLAMTPCGLVESVPTFPMNLLPPASSLKLEVAHSSKTMARIYQMTQNQPQLLSWCSPTWEGQILYSKECIWILSTAKHETSFHLTVIVFSDGTPCCLVYIYRVSQEECARLRENVPYIKVHRYNPKHLIRSWTVTEIMAREVWKYDSCYTLIDYQIHIKTGRNM